MHGARGGEIFSKTRREAAKSHRVAKKFAPPARQICRAIWKKHAVFFPEQSFDLKKSCGVFCRNLLYIICARTVIQRKIHFAAGAPECRFSEKSAFLRAGQSTILGEIRCAWGARWRDFSENTARSRKILPFGKKICAASSANLPRDLEKIHRVFS